MALHCNSTTGKQNNVVKFTMDPTIFIDRDGVINKLIFHEDTQEYGAPRNVSEIIIPDNNVIKSLPIFKKWGYQLIVISNQPDAAKGNTTYKELEEIDTWFRSHFTIIDDFYYCYHHPTRCNCLCRKPGTLLVERAMLEHNVDIKHSIFIGDTYETDGKCAEKMNIPFIKVNSYI